MTDTKYDPQEKYEKDPVKMLNKINFLFTDITENSYNLISNIKILQSLIKNSLLSYSELENILILHKNEDNSANAKSKLLFKSIFDNEQ